MTVFQARNLLGEIGARARFLTSEIDYGVSVDDEILNALQQALGCLDVAEHLLTLTDNEQGSTRAE